MIVGAAAEFQVRPMSRQELGLALDWADRVGWNPGLKDNDCFHAADPEGFLIGYRGEEPVACISSVRYGGNYGFIGFYIVRAELRGRRYGMRIWQAGLASLNDRAVGLMVSRLANATTNNQDSFSLTETFVSPALSILHPLKT